MKGRYILEIIIFILIAIVAVVVILKLLTAPIRLAGKLLINGLVGFVILLFLSFAGSALGITLGIKWFSAIVVGALGAPGVVLLLLLEFLL